MTATTIRHFDALNYVEKSKELGVDEKVAKYQARQIEEPIDIAVNTARTEIENKELATKGDIRKLENNLKELELKIEQLRSETMTEIHKSKFELVIWVAGLLIASGLIQHFFK